MTNQAFEQILDDQLNYCRGLLTSKGKEYDLAVDDRFHSFKTAAAVQNCTPKQALCGMMCKHTISIYDMACSEETFATEKWIEKITDHINYLLLLRGMIEEEEQTHEIH